VIERTEKWTARVDRLRFYANLGMLIMGSCFLAYATYQFSQSGRFRVDDIWIFGLVVPFTFEAAAQLLRPAAAGLPLSIWSMTLMGTSFFAGGLATHTTLMIVLGAAGIAGAYLMAVFGQRQAAGDVNAQR
jgi:hypothetical protein